MAGPIRMPQQPPPVATKAPGVPGTAPSAYSWATAQCDSIFCNNQDEDMLKANLASYGPISIACDAAEWSSYAGGVFTSASCKSSSLRLDHAIQLIGYNEDGDTLLKRTAFYVNSSVANGPWQFAFRYPASLSGHAFGFNQHGLALSMNALTPDAVDTADTKQRLLND